MSEKSSKFIVTIEQLRDYLSSLPGTAEICVNSNAEEDKGIWVEYDLDDNYLWVSTPDMM